MELKIESNLNKMAKELEKVDSKRWPKIIAYASTETAFAVRNKIKVVMPKYINNPKPYTINSIFVKKGSSKNAESVVQWREPGGGGTSGGRYLIPEVEGGKRSNKPFEKRLQGSGFLQSGWVAVPTKDAPKDGYGNVPGAFMKRVLQALSLAPRTYKSDRARKLAANKAQQFFVVTNPNKTEENPAGIYERKRTGFGDAIRLIFAFIPFAYYKRQFPFYQIGDARAREKFPEKIREAISKNI